MAALGQLPCVSVWGGVYMFVVFMLRDVFMWYEGGMYGAHDNAQIWWQTVSVVCVFCVICVWDIGYVGFFFVCVCNSVVYMCVQHVKFGDPYVVWNVCKCVWSVGWLLCCVQCYMHVLFECKICVCVSCWVHNMCGFCGYAV